jgi:hypothetical protein
MWHDGEAETIEIIASVQPLDLKGRTLYVEMLPEGAVHYSAVRIYSNTELRVEKQAQDGIDGQEADILLWRGKRYKVINCEEWQSNVISHFKMVAWEVGAYGQ